VGPSAGLDDVEKRKFLTLPGLELGLLGNPACSQSLYRLRHPGYVARKPITPITAVLLPFVTYLLTLRRICTEIWNTFLRAGVYSFLHITNVETVHHNVARRRVRPSVSLILNISALT
jgi:hypothetical protein